MLSHHHIRVIYEEGPESVAETILQLYEMIETDDERDQRLEASAIAAHLQRIAQLSARITRVEEELLSRARQILQLYRTVKELSRQLREAREQSRLARGAHLATVIKN